MFVPVLFWISLVGGAVALASAFWIDRPSDGFPANQRRSKISAGIGFPGAAVLIAAVVFGFVWLGVFLKTTSGVNEMRAFQDHTLTAYTYTIEQTVGVEISGSTPGLIDVAYLEVGKIGSERLRELRDKVEWYNRVLQKYTYWNGTIFDYLGADVDGLHPIILTGD